MGCEQLLPACLAAWPSSEALCDSLVLVQFLGKKNHVGLMALFFFSRLNFCMKLLVVVAVKSLFPCLLCFLPQKRLAGFYCIVLIILLVFFLLLLGNVPSIDGLRVELRMHGNSFLGCSCG